MHVCDFVYKCFIPYTCTSTCMKNQWTTPPWRKCRSRCFYKVSHCAGRILATRPHQLHWGDWEIGTAIKMQSGRWSYPQIIHMTCVGIRISMVVSSCATVTYNYVPAWGRFSKLQKLPMIHNRMKLLPLCYAASDTACIRTSPDGFSWSKDPAEWREMA